MSIDIIYVDMFYVECDVALIETKFFEQQMNIANITFHALNGIADTLRPVTVEDVCADMPMGRHVKRALEFAYDIPPETEINRTIRWLDRLIQSQVSLRQAKSWAYDSGRLIGLVQNKRSLEEALHRRQCATSAIRGKL